MRNDDLASQLHRRVERLEEDLRGTRNTLRALIVLQVALVVALVLVGMRVMGVRVTMEDPPKPVAVAPATVEEAIPREEARVAAGVSVEEPPDEPAAAEAVAEEEEPELEPEEEQDAEAPTTRASRTEPTLIDTGWTHVENGRLSDAEVAFRQAMASAPAQAHYGLGYIAAQRGRTSEAQRQLCDALAGSYGDVELRRDVNAMLKRYALTCR